MNVGFLTAGCDGGRSGIGQYARELLTRFSGTANDSVDVIAPQGEDDAWMRDLPGTTHSVIPAAFRSPLASVVWTQTGLPLVSARHRHDVLFLPAANRRVPLVTGTPTVGTVHDLAAFHVGAKYDAARMFYIRRVLPVLIRRLTHVITISEASRRDIVEFTGVAPERISVVPLAANHERFTPEREPGAQARIAATFNLQRRYILYVSRIEHPAKNHVRLIEAFEALKATGLPHQLVLAGPDRERAGEVHARAARSPWAADIRFTGFVDDADVPHLYRGADCVVVPSLWEGFGLPVLEAMACGVPVACADVAALPEVAGRAAIVFDPYNHRDMSSALHLLLTDSRARAHYRSAGLQRSRMFNWDRTASATWQVLERVARDARASRFMNQRRSTDECGHRAS